MSDKKTFREELEDIYLIVITPVLIILWGLRGIYRFVTRYKKIKQIIITNGVERAIRDIPRDEDQHINLYLEMINKKACDYIQEDYKRYNIRDYKFAPKSHNGYMWGDDLDEIEDSVKKITGLKYIDVEEE